MTNDEQNAALNTLKALVEENDQAVLLPPCALDCPGCSGGSPISTRTMTDAQLTAQLQLYDWNIKRAAYAVLVYKAKATDVTLSSGIRLPDQSAHYLRLASLYRQNAGGMLHRADDPQEEE